MYGVFVNIGPSSHKIWACPDNMATLSIWPIFFSLIGDCINRVPLYSLANIRCLALHNIPLLWLITSFFNMLILSIAKIYYENRSKNKLKNNHYFTIFWLWIHRNSISVQVMHSGLNVECKNNLGNLNWNVLGSLSLSESFFPFFLNYTLVMKDHAHKGDKH